ncbi:MAG: SemiSWEET transporter [Deltaproteobacteria bacterium]|nr:SemiSWEET transporter [Deltaproteobacteria bacterium]
MDLVNVIGFSAALLSAVSMAPQVLKVYRTKKTGDLSLWAFSVLAGGLFLWLIYGILIRAIPVIIGNAVGFIFSMYIVMMKFRYG